MIQDKPTGPTLDVPAIQRSRAFLAGTARWFSGVGLMLMLSSCLIGMFGGGLMDRPTEAAASLREFLSPERLPFTIKAAGLLATLIGSMGLQAVGLAMGGDLPSGARAGVWVSTTLTLLWSACGIALFMMQGHRWAGAPFLVLAGVGAVLVLFSLRAVLLMPSLPPVDRKRLVRETLEAYERRRRERGRMI